MTQYVENSRQPSFNIKQERKFDQITSGPEFTPEQPIKNTHSERFHQLYFVQRIYGVLCTLIVEFPSLYCLVHGIGWFWSDEYGLLCSRLDG